MRHTILLDSRDRDFDAYPDPSEYRIMLPTVYRNIQSARLVSAEIPASFYVFTAEAQNTSLDITVGSTTATITLPDGNYSSSTFSSALETALTDATGHTFSVTVSKTTLRMTIASDTTDFTIEPSTGTPTGWGLPFYLGFQRDVAYSSSEGVLTAPRIISLNPHNYILLDIDQLNGLDEGSLYGGRVGSGSFAKIPFDAYSFDFVYLDTEKTTFPETVLRPGLASLDRLNIKFRFHDGRPVDFNGVEHSLALEIITKDPVTERPRNPDTAMTAAASTAAAAAASAAIAATRALPLMAVEKNIEMEKRKQRPKKKTLLWVVPYALLAIVVIWILYAKSR
jgi:hypothetical protein